MGLDDKAKRDLSSIQGTYVIGKNTYPNLQTSFLAKTFIGICVSISLLAIAVHSEEKHITTITSFLGIGGISWMSLWFGKSIAFRLRFGYLDRLEILADSIHLFGSNGSSIQSFRLSDIDKIHVAPILGGKKFANISLKSGYASIPFDLEFIGDFIAIAETNGIPVVYGPEYHPG
ncbi:hypothetical protein [Pseudobacteriovorax antillogorgiicola]|uniref:Uncharacterized protein n=1 Tax=Pseudobacteriovorax antillogorgiicola TaxID=1513793 RepID=A0A1Y6BZW4_9BACT|nr:hypothetical protein [Pseudobacteriovorax antillogorgiicola]TCS51131.1 hypothetical protein EDD56_11112 [Pseudobacteriovorax antillogorgiicola]SMF38486.1 hypothetical protein SAMN06296036_111165 [Pseudobacteriovorax antillogorgiicola]